MSSEMQALLNKESSLAEVLSAICAIETFQSDHECSLGISANITLNDLVPELKRQSFIYGRSPRVIVGNYRDHIGNTEMFTKSSVKYAIFLWFFDALMPSLGARAGALSKDEVTSLFGRFKNELLAVLGRSKKFERVFIPLMHKVRFTSSMRTQRAETELVNTFNAIIEAETANIANAVILEPSNIISRLGVAACIDQRMYFLYKRPYTAKFLYEFARDIFMEVRGDRSYFKKLLILDCDNTLWRGIIGEDGIEGIKLSPEDFPGNIFWQAQQTFLSLQKRGVLLALCSKNDAGSVDEVLLKHEFCVLKDEHFVAKKVNWNPKPENIRALAKELDLGLDSFLFLDDSNFECNAVRSELPEVLVFQVPIKISDYPVLLNEISDLFPLDEVSDDKTQKYKLRALAKEEEGKHFSYEDYLRSLETKVIVRKNEREKIKRIAELTQKTNQFNVTTRRYSEQQIAAFMGSADSSVYSFHVSDKFGDSGLVGVCIVCKSDDFVLIDTFLMSCRVIGREVEIAAWDEIRRDLGAKKIQAEFIPTTKNSLVESFFDKLGFQVIFQEGNHKKYYSGDSKNV